MCPNILETGSTVNPAVWDKVLAPFEPLFLYFGRLPLEFNLTKALMDQRTLRHRLLLAGILLLAIGLRVPNLSYGLPYVYGEEICMRQAWKMWNWNGPGLDLNPHFFHYPSLSFYIQLIGQFVYYGVGWLTGTFASPHDMRVLYEQDPSELIILGRAVTACFGIAAVWAVARLGRRLAGAGVGLAAAAILAVLPTHVAASRTAGVDTPLVFFTLLALHAALQVLEQGGRRASLLCGLWIGLAAASKYTGALLGTAFLLAYILREVRERTPLLRTLVQPALWSGLAAAAAVFVLTSPYCFLDFETFWTDFSYERIHMDRGHFGVDPDRTLIAYARDFYDNFGIWLSPVLILGAVGRTIHLKSAPQWIPLIGFMCLYLGIIATWSMQAARYLLPVLPCLVLLAAQGIWDLRRMAAQAVSLPGWTSAGVLSALLILPVGLKTARKTAADARPDTRILARSWVESQVPPGALFAMEHYTPNLDPQTYYTIRLLMDILAPEHSTPCYDLRWYVDYDHIITSSAIADRYLKDPDRFAKQARFYEDLKAQWTLAAEFPGAGAPGPTIRIFHNPERASRAPHAPLDPAVYHNLVGMKVNLARGFLVQHSDIFARKGWYAKAADIHKWLLRIDPTGSSRTLANLGRIAYKKGDLDAAIEIWEHVLRADSSNVDLYTNLGAAYFQKGAHNRAAALWEQGYRIAPGDPEIAHNLAALYWKRNQLRRAVGILNHALQTAPQDPRLHADLGDIYGAKGNYRRAIRYYEVALRLAPDREDFRARLEKLRQDRQKKGLP